MQCSIDRASHTRPLKISLGAHGCRRINRATGQIVQAASDWTNLDCTIYIDCGIGASLIGLLES